MRNKPSLNRNIGSAPCVQTLCSILNGEFIKL